MNMWIYWCLCNDVGDDGVYDYVDWILGTGYWGLGTGMATGCEQWLDVPKGSKYALTNKWVCNVWCCMMSSAAINTIYVNLRS